MLTLSPRFSGQLPAGLQPIFDTQPTLARIYAGRHISDTSQLDHALARLLPADGLLGLPQAVALLDDAIDQQQRILIVGDFDCDGATSTALMMRVLTEMGAVVDFVVPDRFKYGYGLTPEIVELGIRDHQPEVIVTVDNGISSHEGVARAQADGITVIITDHHLTTKPTPTAEAVVNPNQLGCPFASKSLVGVGVAFYLLGNLAKQRRLAGKMSVQVSRYLDLVALGTVADVGVLDHNNRILVQHGLIAIRSGRACVGILALLEQAGRDHRSITAQDFGFILGPRINAAGRMDNMRIGIECLLSDDWGEAQRLAYQLDKLNRDRRHVEGKIRDEADAIVAALASNSAVDTNSNPNSNPNADSGRVIGSHGSDDNTSSDTSSDQAVGEQTADQLPAVGSPAVGSRGLVLYRDDWHQGVIGIVAGRLKDSHYLPTIVFAPADTSKTGLSDAIKGSARSIAGVHIRDAIEQVAMAHPDLISHFGGHAMAAGLTLQRGNLPAFTRAFNHVLAGLDAAVFEQVQYSDGQLQGSDVSLVFAEMLKSSCIWGHGFVPPVFDGVFEVLNTRILKDKHLKLSLRHPEVQYPIDAIWFNYQPAAWDYRAEQVHVLFELDINEWNGSQSVQLMVKDLAVVSLS